MGDLLELLGIAALAVWAACVFGWPAALLVSGIGAIIAGVAVSAPLGPRRARESDDGEPL